MYPGAHAQQAPDRPAVIAAEDGTVLTYRELDDASMRLAQLLYADGLRPEQHIAFLSDNRLEVFGIYWAALRSGLYVTAVNHHLSPDEAAYIVNDCGAEALIVSADAGRPGGGDRGRHTPEVRLRLAFGGPSTATRATRTPSRRMPAEPLPTSRGEPTCCTPRARPAGPRASRPRCRTGTVDEPGDAVRAAVRRPSTRLRRATRVYLSPGADVPRRAAALLRLRPRARRHRRRDGAVRRRSALAASSATASPTASGCRRCSCAC